MMKQARAFQLLVATCAIFAIIGGAACAGFNAYMSGCDARRYEEVPDAATSADLETDPLPSERRPRMLEPRSPFDGGSHNEL